jgi:hypothetical protein
VGAQGMNTGLQDAYNLAWKLALVGKGRADVALLDSYEQERIPVAQRLLSTTDRAFRLVVSDTQLAGLLRTRVIARIAAAAMSRKRIQASAFRIISQTGIRYRASPLSISLEGLSAEAPRAGDRFPWLRLRLRPDGPVEDLFQALDDTRLNLLVFGEISLPDAARDAGDLLRIFAIPADSANERELARANIPRPSFYLLRPDNYVGLCGPRLEARAVGRYLFDCLRLDAGASRQTAATAEARPWT